MATVAHEPRTPPLNNQFQQWSFEKAMLEAQQRSPSESSSAEFDDGEGKVRITPNMEELKRTIEQQKSPAIFNEKYMSSEEALSPTDHEGDGSDDGSDYEDATTVKFAVCDMAIAICIIPVGKAKIVDLPVPSLTSSPSIGSEVERPERTDSMPKPTYTITRKPVLRERNPRRRPILRNAELANSSSEAPTQSASTVPTLASTPSDEIDAQHKAVFRSMTTQPVVYTLSRETHSAYPTPQPSFLSQDPFADSPPPRTQHSRLRNISQKIGRFALYGPSGKPAEEAEQEPEPLKLDKILASNGRRSSLQLQTQDAEATVTTNASSAPKRKMVPRGAAERAETIEIPPCPYDLDDDSDPVHKVRRVRRRKSLMGF